MGRSGLGSPSFWKEWQTLQSEGMMSLAGLTVASHPILPCVLFWSQKAALRSVVAGALVLLVAGAIPFASLKGPAL